MNKPSTLMLQAEEKHNMGFKRIVRKYAADGFSVYATGKALGYSQGAFSRTVRRLGLREVFKADGRVK